MTQGSPETGNPGLSCATPLGLDVGVKSQVSLGLWGATLLGLEDGAKSQAKIGLWVVIPLG